MAAVVKDLKATLKDPYMALSAEVVITCTSEIPGLASHSTLYLVISEPPLLSGFAQSIFKDLSLAGEMEIAEGGLETADAEAEAGRE
jgi:hypothetical protein